MKNKKVCNKTRSLSASLLLKGQGTEHTTVKIMVYSYKSKYTVSVKTGTIILQERFNTVEAVVSQHLRNSKKWS